VTGLQLSPETVFSPLPEQSEEIGIAIRAALSAADRTSVLLAENELLASAAARSLVPPDHSAAFFHAYRAVEGYLENIVLRPVVRALLIPADPTWRDFAPREIFQQRFRERVLRQALLTGFGSEAVDTVASFFRNFLSVRHRTMHGFYQPSDDEARRCLQSAQEIIDILEMARAAMREENHGI
jgi:hypothetical protein